VFAVREKLFIAAPHPLENQAIANMLGVRREGVTEAALNLQRVDLISYARGRISVLDRAGLEKRTCECYAVVKTEYDRLLLPSGPRSGRQSHVMPIGECH
jgi:hypothetical protein